MRVVAGLVLALLARPAAAGDACLAGSATLGDQRALVALEQASDTHCPCASFHGARRSYRVCAEKVVRAQLDQGALRPQCRKAAKAIADATACGVHLTACGQVRSSAARPVACRVTAPERCTDGRGIQATACTDTARCADVVEWTAGTCTDPRSLGPFVPGVKVITFSKKSVVDPTQDRPLQTYVWYPARSGAGPIDPRLGGVLDAPPDPSAGPYPLLMFSHGSCGYPLQSTFLTPLVASYGFVVAAPPHPGNTLAEFPGCGSPQELVDSLRERPQDILFVLDQMLAADHDPGSPFFGVIDPGRLGMSGHSFGGLTTYLLTGPGTRFQVAVPLAGAVLGTPTMTVPSLTMVGAIDSVVSVPEIVSAFTDATRPRFLVEIGHAGHYAFSDLCFPSPDCNPPATLSQAEAHEVVQRWVVPFLEIYLARKGVFSPFLLPPARPGVSFTPAA